MTEEWDSEAYALLAEVAKIESVERQTAFLDEACAGDQELRRRVVRLLTVYRKAGSFLDAPAAPGPEATVAPRNERIGTRIGAYKILQEIGEGGFGVVYMAEQHRPVRRKVALKIIKPGMDSREVIARFEAEQQALAMMDHPNIARVLDAGTTDNGRPYFVMELVQGVPITEYCDKNNMPMPERLRLFVTVCRAVQHAHQKGVIHRDLKPSNIMVTLHDGKPVPKVIDFGVAKAISHQLTEKTLFTHYGQMIGTPQYMSPEQAEMSGLEVDTRSDIYSLGVLLYEILTATTPLTADQLRARGYAEIQRIICEEEAPTPSTRISTLGDRLTIVASHRQCDARKLRQFLSGELDWIVMRSLDKDRARRYETAGAFASDIEAYLRDDPVQARPPSVGYLLGKTLRKHRVLAITSAIVVLILVVATAISIWQAIHAYHLGQVANEAKAAAEANLQQARASERLASNEAEDAESARQEADRLRKQSERAEDIANRKAYVSDMYHASLAYARGDIGEMNAYLDRQPRELRDFAWYHWWLAGHLHRELMYDATRKWNLTASPDGAMIAVGAMPQTTRLYRTEDSVLVAVLRDAGGTPAFSPDGELVAVHDIERRKIKIWRTDSGALIQTLDVGGGEIRDSFAFSPARTPPIFAVGDEDGRITVWESSDSSDWRLRDAVMLPTAVRGLTFTSKGESLVAGTESGEVVIYDVASLEKTSLLKHSSGIRKVTYSPATDVLAVCDHDGIRFWDSRWKPIATLSDLPWIKSMAFSADGDRLIAGTSQNKVIMVWDLGFRPPRLLASIRGHAGEVVGIGFGPPDSNTIWSASGDLTIREWDLAKCQPFDTLDHEFPDGSRLTYADEDTLMIARNGGSLRRSDREAGQWGEIRQDVAAYSSVAVSDDGAVLAGVEDNVLHVRDVNDPTPTTIELVDLDATWSRDFTRPLAVTRNEHGPSVALAFEGGNPWNTGYLVIDMRSADERCRIPTGTDVMFNAILSWPVFSPDGDRLAVSRVDRCEIWDVSGTEAVLERSFQGPALLRCAAFSPDGKAIAIAGEARHINMFDIDTGMRTRMSGHADFVNSLAFSRPDGAFLISGGDDGTVRMWKAETGQQQSVFTGHREAVTSVAISPTLDSIASRGGDRKVRIWKRATDEDVRNNVDQVVMHAASAGFHHDRPASVDIEEMLASLDEAIERCPNNWKLYDTRGGFHRLARDWTKATSDYDRAIELGPGDGVLYEKRAEMYLRDRRRDDAVEDFVKAIRLSPFLSSRRNLMRIRDSFALGEEITPERARWRYTTEKPPADWTSNEFDDAGWPSGHAPFGVDSSLLGLAPRRRANTLWWETDIWLRHEFHQDEAGAGPLVLNSYVNDFAEVFLNGVQVRQLKANPAEGEISTNWWEGVVQLADVQLKPGKNVVAVHCGNVVPYMYGKIDVGLYLRAEEDSSFEKVLEEVLQVLPNREDLWRVLIEQHVRRQNWQQAAKCCEKLRELTPTDANAWLEQSALLVYLGNLEEYEQVRGRMLQLFEGNTGWQTPRLIAKACLLAPPGEVTNVEAIRLMAHADIDPDPDGWLQLVTGALLEDRQGDDRAVIDKASRLLEQLEGFPPMYRDAAVFRVTLCLKAMAHARLGELEAAGADLEEFETYLETNSPLRTGDPPGRYWRDWLICEIFLREANRQGLIDAD